MACMYSDATWSCDCAAVALFITYLRLCWPQLWELVGITAKELLPLSLPLGCGAYMNVAACPSSDGEHVCGACRWFIVSISGKPMMCTLMCSFFSCHLIPSSRFATHILGIETVAENALSCGNPAVFTLPLCIGAHFEYYSFSIVATGTAFPG